VLSGLSRASSGFMFQRFTSLFLSYFVFTLLVVTFHEHALFAGNYSLQQNYQSAQQPLDCSPLDSFKLFHHISGSHLVVVLSSHFDAEVAAYNACRRIQSPVIQGKNRSPPSPYLQVFSKS